MNNAIIAYDIGGTKVKSGLISSSGQIIDQSTTLSRAGEGPSAIMAAASSLTASLRARNPTVNIRAGAVATGGVVSRESGSIEAAVDFMPGWGGFEIVKAFRQLVGHRVQVDNDGNCALFAEIKAQNLEDKDAVLLALGTGLGGALYLDGSVRGGAAALAGHFGQTLVGELSTAGEWQQLETFLSGNGLANMARSVVKEHDPSVDPEKLFADGQAVIAAVPHSDVAKTALSRWARLLARTCHNIQWNYDPDTIIIGGGMVEAKSSWWPEFEQSLKNVNARFGLPQPMDVRPAQLGNDAAMVGAALMAWAQLGGSEE